MIARGVPAEFIDMATPEDAFNLLIDIVLVMDTGVFYGQMEHASTFVCFQIYIWSWLVVGFFLLINIFIAIVIDAYVAVKEENTSKLGMHEELTMMFHDWYNSMKKPKLLQARFKVAHLSNQKCF